MQWQEEQKRTQKQIRMILSNSNLQISTRSLSAWGRAVTRKVFCWERQRSWSWPATGRRRTTAGSSWRRWRRLTSWRARQSPLTGRSWLWAVWWTRLPGLQSSPAPSWWRSVRWARRSASWGSWGRRYQIFWRTGATRWREGEKYFLAAEKTLKLIFFSILLKELQLKITCNKSFHC